MPDYQKMYYYLFSAITSAIEAMDELNIGQAKQMLILAQQKTEDIYISADEN